MTDIVERLRLPLREQETVSVFVALCREAADEIERLRRALEEISELPGVRSDEAASIASRALVGSGKQP